MVITQREAVSVQDALGRKLNNHWRQSLHKEAWPKQINGEGTGATVKGMWEEIKMSLSRLRWKLRFLEFGQKQ